MTLYLQGRAEPIRVGETAIKLAECFGPDFRLPFPIPVWVADVNCEREAYAATLVQLRTADGDGNPANVSYADLEDGRKVNSLEIFIRGDGYRSPETMKFTDDHGEFTQPGQMVSSK